MPNPSASQSKAWARHRSLADGEWQTISSHSNHSRSLSQSGAIGSPSNQPGESIAILLVKVLLSPYLAPKREPRCALRSNDTDAPAGVASDPPPTGSALMRPQRVRFATAVA